MGIATVSVPDLIRILYVEDEPDIRLVTTMALEKVAKFTLKSCSSGAEALAAAADFAPQLLILDVMMPALDGPATLAKLRELPATADTPAIFLTAKSQAHEIRRYLDLGAIEVIVKPYEPMTLGTRVREIWARYHGQG